MEADDQDKFVEEVAYIKRQASRKERRTGKPHIGRHTLGADYEVALALWKAVGIDAKTPMGEFRPYILRCLLELADDALYQDVIAWIEQKGGHMLTDYDRTEVSSGKVRWKQAVSGEGAQMRKEGLIASGIWDLTPEGRAAAEELT